VAPDVAGIDDDPTVVDHDHVLEQIGHLVDQVGGEKDRPGMFAVVGQQPVVEVPPVALGRHDLYLHRLRDHLLGHRPPASGSHVGALASFFIVVFALGIQSVSQALPFGLALGVSRRVYLPGTVLLVTVLAAVYGPVLSGLQEVERAAGGWGVNLHFFRVGFILNGPWYATWLTAFVGLVLMFTYGMWFGLVYRRLNFTGLVAFMAGQITVLLVAALAVRWAHVWKGVGHVFTNLSAGGLTGVLTLLAAVLVCGGLATVRRVTV